MANTAAVFHTFCEPPLRPLARELELLKAHPCTVYALSARLDGFESGLPVVFGHNQTCAVPKLPVTHPAGRLRRSFWRHFARAGHELVIAPSGPEALTALPMAQFFNLPLVCFLSGADLTWLFRPDGPDPAARRYAARKGELFAGVTRFVVPCPSFYELLSECGCPREKIQLHVSGLALEPPPPAPQNRRPVILLQVPPAPVGGLDIALTAFELLHASAHEAQLWILADEAQRTALRSRIDESPARADLFLVAEAEAEDAWNRADLVLWPPVVSPGFFFDAPGRAILEASARGKPVVATCHAGAADRVAADVTGLLIPERDAVAMADALARLLGDPDLRAELGRAGRAKMELEYALPVTTARLEKIFSGVVAKSG
ncbi:glycosyltransferase family 4 protein [Myxococcota bacterium]|nr:glycosyltransferase family 4 protein [Myxococcota bacterium]